jgi:hypothetical protein
LLALKSAQGAKHQIPYVGAVSFVRFLQFEFRDDSKVYQRKLILRLVGLELSR